MLRALGGRVFGATQEGDAADGRIGFAELGEGFEEVAVGRVDLGAGSGVDCYGAMSVSAGRGGAGAGAHTSLIAIEDARDADQVDGHAQLGIGLDVQRLLPREPRRIPGAGVLSAREAGAGDVEELGRVRRRGEGVGVADAGDVVLVHHPLGPLAGRHGGRR